MPRSLQRQARTVAKPSFNQARETGKYMPSEIEKKWQEAWEKQNSFELDSSKEKFYTLVELPYPSGDLHMGHWFTFVTPDVLSRYMRMKGKNVFFPHGYDAFGLPAENAAIKRGIHPQDWTMKNIETMTEQFKTMGTIIDWSKLTITCLPEYYKWNQWIFIKMFEEGLAVRKKALSNWCPKDQTVLANEHVENGTCWRCGTEVVQKEVEQWFLKITDYADRLIWPTSAKASTDAKAQADKSAGKPQDPEVDWPQSVRDGQNNWIGKSTGTSIKFKIEDNKPRDILVVHGVSGSSSENWFPWLKNSLKQKGSRVVIPDLPGADHPKIEEWNKSLQDSVSDFSDDSVVIGHSLGAPAALNLVQSTNKKFRKLILAAPVNPDQDWGHLKEAHKGIDWQAVKEFADIKFDWGRIKSQVDEIVIYYSDNDSYIPASSIEFYKANLPNATFKERKGMGHFNASSGVTEFEELLEGIAASSTTPRNDKITEIEVFTTRPDTLFGATFIVVAPEHPLVQDINGSIKKYIESVQSRTKEERLEAGNEKTGIFTGLIAINPVNNEHIPVWIADYALIEYGTGALFGDAHDERDVEFAKKYKIPLKPTLATGDKERDKRILALEEVFTGYGTLVDSGEFSGLRSEDAIEKVTDWLEKHNSGKRQTVYHLRDWSISRQRYWGTPVPMVNCQKCGVNPVALEDLPVTLPYDVDYTPKGKPPLASNEKWLKTKCPKCGGEAERDPETLDTFFDSSWYFLRYVNPSFDKGPFDTDKVKKLLPVDIYFGGGEHTLGHTLYARFFTKFFKDLGLVDFEEFAKKRIQHGIVLGPDGNKMSKSKGNVINPDAVVAEYGADAVRLYLCFMIPYEATAPWAPTGIFGTYRFLKRVWELYEKVEEAELSREDEREMNRTIKKVGSDIEKIKMNTAIAALMEWINYLSRKKTVPVKEYETLLLLLAPFAPHMTEELYQQMANSKWQIAKENHTPSAIGYRQFSSIHLNPWPAYDPEYLSQDQATIVIQVNGKVRDTFRVQSSEFRVQSKMEELAKASEKIRKYLEGKKIIKVIYVEGKLINFVVV